MKKQIIILFSCIVPMIALGMGWGIVDVSTPTEIYNYDTGAVIRVKENTSRPLDDFLGVDTKNQCFYLGHREFKHAEILKYSFDGKLLEKIPIPDTKITRSTKIRDSKTGLFTRKAGVGNLFDRHFEFGKAKFNPETRKIYFVDNDHDSLYFDLYNRAALVEYDLNSGKIKPLFYGKTHGFGVIQSSGHNRYIAIVDYPDTFLIDTENGQVYEFKNMDHIKISPDGSTGIGVHLNEKTHCLFSLPDGKRLAEVYAHAECHSKSNTWIWSHNGKYLYGYDVDEKGQTAKFMIYNIEARKMQEQYSLNIKLQNTESRYLVLQQIYQFSDNQICFNVFDSQDYGKTVVYILDLKTRETKKLYTNSKASSQFIPKYPYIIMPEYFSYE